MSDRSDWPGVNIDNPAPGMVARAERLLDEVEEWDAASDDEADTPDPITPERVTLTEGERRALRLAGFSVDSASGDSLLTRTIERILSDRLRAAQADAWDRLCNWLDDHVDSDVRASVKRAARDTNPYRGGDR